MEPAALLERLFDAFAEERWEEYPDILADDIVAHENGEEIRGLEEQLEFEKDYKRSNPDAAVTVEEMATSGNTVFSRGVAPGGGTHLLCAHEITSAGSGRRWKCPRNSDRTHVEDGKITEFWVLSE